MTIGLRLRHLRRQHGLSQKEFGDRIGELASTVSKLENGERRFFAETLEAIRKEFDVNLEWLVSGEGEMDKNSVIQIREQRLHVEGFTGKLESAFRELMEMLKNFESRLESLENVAPNANNKE